MKDKVYSAVKSIPKGRVATYGDIALLSGYPGAQRAMGRLLHNNPFPGVVPCHRVVFVDGRLASAFAFGGEGVQRSLLEKEGVTFTPYGKVDMAKCRIKYE